MKKPTRIELKTKHVVIPAILNDTVTAQEFKKRLPFSVTGVRSSVEYYCAAACGIFDPTETQSGWKNGDICLARGWFTVHFDGEETSNTDHGMMIIAHIDEEHLPLVRDLPNTVKFVVELSKCHKVAGNKSTT